MDEKYFDGCAYTLAYLFKNHKDKEAVQFISEIYHNGRTEQSKRDRDAVRLAIREYFETDDEAFYYRAHGIGCDILAALEAAAIREIK